MVTPEKHAGRLSNWLMRTDLGGSDVAAEEHWGSAVTWLTLASGVMDLKIDLTVNQRANYMCSAAWPYEDAQNATASKVHLELTRLLYAYCAVESMTRAMDPTYGDDGKLVKHAKPIVSRYTSTVPPHFLCIVDHLYDAEEVIHDSIDISDWRRAFKYLKGRSRCHFKSGRSFGTYWPMAFFIYRHRMRTAKDGRLAGRT